MNQIQRRDPTIIGLRLTDIVVGVVPLPTTTPTTIIITTTHMNMNMNKKEADTESVLFPESVNYSYYCTVEVILLNVS